MKKRIFPRWLKVFGIVLICLVALILLGGPPFRWVTEQNIYRVCAKDAKSQDCLGRARMMGEIWINAHNQQHAEAWWMFAAEKGDAVSMFNLGWLYQQYFEQSLRSRMAIAEMPDSTRPFIEKDQRDVAKSWYQKSADAGFAPAMNNLAEMYALDTPAEPAKAMELFIKAAAAGNPVAQWNIYLENNRIPNPSDTIDRSWWNPKNCSLTDVSTFTLGRTMLFGTPIPQEQRAILQEAFKEGVPIQLNFSPLKADPSIPTFRQVQEGLKD